MDKLMTKHQYRKTFIVVFCAFLALSTGKIAANQTTQPKTIILVRHAEKKVVLPENKDPDLSAEGESRAKEISRMFSGSGITAIYATQFKRTQQTVKPLAERLKSGNSRGS